MRVVPVLILLLLAAPYALAQGGNSTGNQSANATGNTTATPSATPMPTGPQEVALTATGHVDGSTYYWTFDGITGHNPTVPLPAGAHVTVTVKNSGTAVHNFAVAPDTKGSDFVSSPDETATYQFTAAASGTMQYYCVPHKSSGMTGQFSIGAASTGGASTPAAAATPAPTAITVTAHAEGGTYYWTVEGFAGKNPTITVAPDTDITVTVKNSGDQTHNFGVGITTKASDYVSSPADVVTFTFHSGPEGASSEYFCVPHKSSGMKGTLKFAKDLAPAAPSGGGSGQLTGNINGDAADLGQFDAACAGQSIPAASASKEIGGPTIPDYIQRCQAIKAGTLSEDETRPASNADYVIPISLALIGLGIVGVVWVHKFYKP